MARKRGGLAGLYDRNKGLIRTASTIGASLLGGPAAGAAVGAAFRGFDRPGQSGIGFDVGQGLRGAAEGYTTGKLTQAGQAGLSKLFAPKAAGMSAGMGGGMGSALPADLPMSGAPSMGMAPTAAGSMNVGAPRMAAPDIGSLLKPAQRETGRGFGRAVADFTKGLEGRSKTIEGITKGIQMALPNPASDAALMNAETQRRQLEMQQAQMNLRNRQDEQLAQLLMPLYQQMMQSRVAMPPTSLGGYLRMNDFPDDTMPVTSSRAPAPMRSSVSPVRGGVAPVRSGVLPVSRLR